MGSWGRRPPDNGAGEVRHPGWGARPVTVEPARDWRCPRELSWHLSARGSTYYSLKVVRRISPRRRSIIASGRSNRNSGSFWKSTESNTTPSTCCEDCGPGGCCGHVSEVLAPRRGARPSDAVFRWSFPLCPERPPATLCQPCGLASASEFGGKCPNSSARICRAGPAVIKRPSGETPSGSFPPWL